jgi:hypothetical protein
MPGKKQKDKKGSKITRREILKLGATTGGLTLITSTKAFRTHLFETVNAQGTTDCLINPGTSPPTDQRAADESFPDQGSQHSRRRSAAR